MEIFDRLLALAAAQIRMDHIALDRSRPNDRHLNHEIVVGARLQTGQHGHLSPALDLKGAAREVPAQLFVLEIAKIFVREVNCRHSPEAIVLVFHPLAQQRSISFDQTKIAT